MYLNPTYFAGSFRASRAASRVSCWIAGLRDYEPCMLQQGVVVVPLDCISLGSSRFPESFIPWSFPALAPG